MIEELNIRSFRSIKSLDISDIKRFNVFVGQNGIGKTDILNYVRLHKGGILDPDIEDIPLIDEMHLLLFDDFMHDRHYANIKDDLETLLRLDHQVFVATQSIDVLHELERIVSGDLDYLGIQKDIMVYNIAKVKGITHKAYSYDFDQFKHAMYLDNEIR